MSQDQKARADSRFTTSIRPLGNGHYGVRVLRDGEVVMQDNSAPTREEAAKALKECLRMLDKCCNPSPMASASRSRFFCEGKAR